MPRATITSKGQITLPKEVRYRLGVDAGDQVEFLVAADGTITVVSLQGSAHRLFGILDRQDRGVCSVEDMDRAVAQSLSEDDERIREGR